MARKAEEIAIEIAYAYRFVTHRLCSIDKHKRAESVSQGDDIAKGVYRTEHV